jgi:hypothetical protein
MQIKHFLPKDDKANRGARSPQPLPQRGEGEERPNLLRAWQLEAELPHGAEEKKL